ncbi:histidine phosphatase family protein [Tepidibacter hydrothermalis]|uniref:Histidine phosphatase family protein n=1 Tax=Tepidibacter hydrothermalis TaxID=3036126 RepID=A0ABY8EGJ4_9FIRM|nr:histidine phosphatase family protein [Tepidibacter hydrothermalis]WFD12066.1 histidine phosphatase family protein [Tepidibacter hydrothermalis]
MQRLIYLIRHGETELGGEKRYVGHTDCSLSNKGIDRIKGLKSTFSNIPVDHVFCSDLLRTKQTANILFPNKKIVSMTELREINMGKWDGLTFKEVREQYPEMFEKRIHNIGGFIVPDGESFRDCQKRAFHALEKLISNTNGNLAVCGHAGFFRSLIIGLLNMNLHDIFKINQDYGCINILKVSESIEVESINLKKLWSEYDGKSNV